MRLLTLANSEFLTYKSRLRFTVGSEFLPVSCNGGCSQDRYAMINFFKQQFSILLMSTTTTTTQLNSRNVLILRPRSIDLQIPLFEDPRQMPRKKLIPELKKRGLGCVEKTPVLQARLLKAIIEENRINPIDPSDMNDRQPEKWLRIANLAFEEACQIEENPEARIECMNRSNIWIETNITDCNQLKEAAKGKLCPSGESPLFLALLRFGASLMIQPLVEQQAALDFNVSSQSLRGSAFISQLCTGFTALPEHLTEERAILDGLAENKLKKKRKKIVHIKDESSTIDIELNRELFVEVGNERFVKARVTRVEQSDDSTSDAETKVTIFAKPTSSQFGGPKFEFQLDKNDYNEAISREDEAILETIEENLSWVV